MTEHCAACGGELTEDGYRHTDDCRIGRGTRRARESARVLELLEAGSLGTPSARVLRDYGRMLLRGVSAENAEASLTPAELAAMRAELDRLVSSRWRK